MPNKKAIHSLIDDRWLVIFYLYFCFNQSLDRYVFIAKQVFLLIFNYQLQPTFHFRLHPSTALDWALNNIHYIVQIATNTFFFIFYFA